MPEACRYICNPCGHQWLWEPGSAVTCPKCESADTEPDRQMMTDPICLVHGLHVSEHDCLYCCICFTALTLDECNMLPDGSKEDVCVRCAKAESERLTDAEPDKR